MDGIKPGYKTTEFWASVIVAMAGLVKQAGLPVGAELVDKVAVLLTTVLPIVAYIISRGLAKKNA